MPVKLNAQFAQLYQAGRYAEAVEIAKRSLALAENQTHPDARVLGQCLNNLGLLYRTQGRYAEAEPLLKRSLATFEKGPGPDYLDVSGAPTFEKGPGPDHLDSSGALSNLAELYREQSRYLEAEPLYQRSLALAERAGPDHPSVGRSLNNLALLYMARWAALLMPSRCLGVLLRLSRPVATHIAEQYFLPLILQRLWMGTFESPARIGLGCEVAVNEAYRIERCHIRLTSPGLAHNH